METNKINVDDLLKKITTTIKDFIQTDLNVVGDLSNETGISSEEILKIVYMERISIENIICLYNTIQIRIEANNQKIIERMNSQETERLLNLQLTRLKQIIQENPNIVGNISNETGKSPEEIFRIIHTDGTPAPSVMQLYSAAQKVLKAKSQEIIARNVLSEETEALITKQLEEVKAYVKTTINVVGDLSRESGLSTEEILKIVYVYTIDMIPITKLAHLHSSVQKLRDAKSQEMIGRLR